MVAIGRGLIAGAAATAALSGLMALKGMMGVMPELDLPSMISTMMGAPGSAALGWAVHAMIGIGLYGLAIAVLDQHLPGRSHILHGMAIGLGGWVMMMAILMPMAGAGLFAMAFGMMAPMMTLVLHGVFGAVLGGVFGALDPRTKARELAASK